MRGINSVILSGNVSGKINFAVMGAATEVLSFLIASDRWANGTRVTVWVKINVYIENLVRICKTKLRKGEYVIIQGELMNRDGVHGELTEVRAREIIFLNGR